MAQFSYKAADQNGRVVTGTQDASDEKGVVAALQAQGYIPIRITPGDGASTLFSLKKTWPPCWAPDSPWTAPFRFYGMRPINRL
jgi:type II secretory pathway component PulF